MGLKQEKRPKNQDRLRAGVCIEPLEPRLLLSGTWGAGIDGPAADEPASADKGLDQTAVLPAIEKAAQADASAKRPAASAGTIDLLTAAPAIHINNDTFHTADLSPLPNAATAPSAALDATGGVDSGDATAVARSTCTDAPVEAVRELVLINDNVADYEQLIAGLENGDGNRTIEVVVLDSSRDGIEQVSAILAERSDLSALHVVTHGSEGRIALGGTWLNSSRLAQDEQSVATWGDALTDSGDLLFYGCNIAADSLGQGLLKNIATLTGTDVSASNDLTGSPLIGGNWQLEFMAGEVTTRTTIDHTVASNWSHLLAAPNDLQATSTVIGGLSLNTDGGNDAGLVADDGASLLGGLTTVTIEATFSMIAPATDNAPLLSYADGTNDEELALFIKNDGSIWFLVHSPGAPYQSTASQYTQLFDGNSHHVGVTWDATNGAVVFYVDGQQVESFTGYQTGQAITATGELVVGQDQDSVLGGYNTIDVFSGTMYDLRIFNDVRTVGEIADHYRQTLTNSEPGLIANWTFSDLSGVGVVTDTVSGNNLNLMHVTGTGFAPSTPVLNFEVYENAVNGTAVGIVTGSDPDGDTLTYTLTDDAGGRFAIDLNSGLITVVNSALLDYESNSSHTITVRVTDTTSSFYEKVFGIQVIDAANTLWISGDQDSVTGANGLPGGWREGEVLQFGEPGLTLGTTTRGEFSSAIDFDAFTTDATDPGALHFVSRDLTIGSGANQFNLQVGDVLVSFNQDETILAAHYETGIQTTVHMNDLLAFRPDVAGDYTLGTFYMLLNGVPDPTGATINSLHAVTLVEQDTYVGQTLLAAGSFLFSEQAGVAPNTPNHIYHFTPTDVGQVAAAGTSQILIDGGDIDIQVGSNVRGLDLIEKPTDIGGLNLDAGDILVTLMADDGAVGDNGLITSTSDIFVLKVTESEPEAGSTAATAEMVFDGSQVNFDVAEGERVYAISIVPDNVGPSVSGDDTGAVTEDVGVLGGNISDSGNLTVADPDAGESAFSAETIVGSYGSLTIDAAGAWTYTADNSQAAIQGLDAGNSLTDLFLVTTADGTTQRVTITINGANDVPGNTAPVATDDPGAYSAALLALNPLSYWRLGDGAGSAADIGTSGNAGTYTGGTLGQAGAITGDSDTTVYFDAASSEYVAISHANDYLLDNGTIQLWFNADTAATGDLQHLFSKDSQGNDTGGHLSIYLTASGRLETRFQSDSASYFVTSPAAVTAGQWHHVAFSFGAGGMALYLDGALVDTDGYTGGTGATSGDIGNFDPIAIGGGTQTSDDLQITPVDQFFTGRIDEVAIIGSQLSAAAILDLYAAGIQDYAVGENGTLAVTAATGLLVNDEDANGDGLSVTELNGSAATIGTQVILASGARLTLNADGSFAYDPNGQFEHLTAGQIATDTFSYTVDDSNGGTDTATVTITISGANDLPIARPDGVHLSFDGNDVVRIADDAALQMTNHVTMEAWINHNGGGTGSQLIFNKEGEYEMGITADTGEIKYAIAENTDTWSWHNTGHFVTPGEWSHVAVTFDGVAGEIRTYVNGTLVDTHNQPGPMGDVYTMYNDVSIGGRENATDQRFQGEIDEVRVWNTTRTQGEIQAHMHSLLTGAEAGLAGYWRLDEAGTGSIVDRSGNGNDGVLGGSEGASATPVYQGYVTDEDTPLAISALSGVLANDTDRDGDPLTVVAINGNAADVGSPIVLASGALVRLNADGSLSYDPNGGFDYLAQGETATDTFTYVANDGSSDSNSTTVTITNTGVNDTPTAVDDSFTLAEGANSTLNPIANDTDTDDGLDATAIAIVSAPAHGALVINGDGTVDYHHDGSENFSDSFTYTIDDLHGATSNTVTVSLTITAQNDAPVNTVPGTLTVIEDTPTAIAGISISDSDAASGDLTTRLTVTNGTLAVRLAGSATISAGADGTSDLTIQGTVTDINATLASLIYTGNLNLTGPSVDTLVIQTDDGGHAGAGGAQQDTDTIQITITAINDAPTISAIANQTIAVGGTTGALVFTVSDIETAATSLAVSVASSDTTLIPDANLNLVDLGGGSWTIEAIPATGRSGGPVTISVSVTDGTTTASESFAIIVTPINGTDPADDHDTVPVTSGTTDPNPPTAPDPTDGASSPEPDSGSEPEPEAILPPMPAASSTEEIARIVPGKATPLAQATASRIHRTVHLPRITLNTAYATDAADRPAPAPEVATLDAVPRRELLLSPTKIAKQIGSMFTAEALTQTLEQLEQQLDLATSANNRRGQLAIGAATGLGVSVFAGYVIWAFRGTSLIMGALSALPMWRCFDPLPVLLKDEKERQAESQQDKDEDKIDNLLGIEERGALGNREDR